MEEIGIDIVDNQSIRKKMTTNFIQHVLSKDEMPEYNACNDKVQYIAGRIAAKEAIIKCLKTLKITDMTKITISNGEYGEPLAFFEDYKIKVSISHAPEYTIAIAFVISTD